MLEDLRTHWTRLCRRVLIEGRHGSGHGPRVELGVEGRGDPRRIDQRRRDLVHGSDHVVLFDRDTDERDGSRRPELVI